MSSLYILELKPLSEVSLANIVSHRVGSLLILLMFSLLCRSFSFAEVPFIYYFLYVPCSRRCIGKNVAACISEIFLPMFSFRSFMVSQLILKSFIHLQFILVCGVIW